MSIKTAVVVLAALTASASIGCGKGGGSIPDANSSTTRASLHRAKDCGGLLSDLRADAKFKLDHSIDYQIQGIKACQAHYPDSQCAYYGGYGGVSYGVDDVAPVAESAGAATNTSASAPSSAGAADSAGSSSSGSGGSKSAGATDFSQTNTQVEGVDEADIVKNDGENLYILHGRAFKVIKAFPASAMSEVGSIDIEGTPNEMFVANGTVVVYSQVNGAHVFTDANVKARSSYTDFGYAMEGDAVSNVAVAPTTAAGAPDEPVGTTTPVDAGPYIPLTKVTVLTLANGTAPVVTRESYFEGNYLDSRRVGTSVRSVFQGNSYGPTLKYGVYDLAPNTQVSSGTQMLALLEQLRQANYAIIDASTIGDWLPYTFVKSGNTTIAQTTQCSDFYVPTIGSTENGITEVSTIDLGDPNGIPRDTAILGAADTVYASADSMYIAARAWIDPPFAWYDSYAGGGVASSGGSDGSTSVSAPPVASGGTGTASPGAVGGASAKSLKPLTAPTVQPTSAPVAWSQTNTHLHKFEFTTDPHFANYLASGTVAGSIKDQFSMDDLNGNLRIATTEQRNYYATEAQGDNVYVPADGSQIVKGGPVPVTPASLNHLFVLAQNGPWLDVQGDAGAIAPNETIQSVRFVGTKGYLTTYRQVDPLFVFDLSTPNAPKELGELTIAGFSEYMQPIDDNHLITIGRDASNQLQLQIFDVSNPAAPNRTFATAYTGDAYASSDAEYDHKAFTYFADKGLLAIPFYSYGYNVNGQSMHSSLEVFKVDVNSGITHLGSVDGTSLVSKYQNGYCGGYYGPDVRRGVFLDTTVYAITYGGIAAQDVSNLAAPATLYPLPAPIGNDIYNGGGEMVAMPACAVAVDPAPPVSPQPAPSK